MGLDRDTGAIFNSIKNAKKANAETICQFETSSISGANTSNSRTRYCVSESHMENVGNRKSLFALYRSLGQTCQKNLMVGKSVLSQAIQGLLKQLS